MSKKEYFLSGFIWGVIMYLMQIFLIPLITKEPVTQRRGYVKSRHSDPPEAEKESVNYKLLDIKTDCFFVPHRNDASTFNLAYIYK